MMRVFKTALFVCSAVLALLPAGAQDLTIVSRVTKDGGPARTQTSYISISRMRMANPDGNDVMADYATGTITIIDGKKKEYFVVTKQDMDEMAAQMQAHMKEMEARMSDLPAGVKDKMSGMMGGFAESIHVAKGTGRRTIAGYACDNWIVTMGEMSKQEHCMTTQIPFPEPAYDAMKSFSSMASGAMDSIAKSTGQLYEKFKEMKGFSLASTATVKVFGKTSTSTSEVTEVKKGSIPASAWEIPAGFKKVDSPFSKMKEK